MDLLRDHGLIESGRFELTPAEKPSDIKFVPVLV